jgi:single-strand DNA-binding protein
MSFNKIIVVGNLGKDPELRYTPQGTPVCSFSVATNEKRKNREGEKVDVTTWYEPTIYGRQAELASQYLQKGRPVYLEGRLRPDEWTDREGKQRFTLKIDVTDMQFIGGGNGNGERSESAAAAGAGAGAGTGAQSDPSDDDMPF